MTKTFEQKRAQHLAELDWYQRAKTNYELRLDTGDDYVGIEYRIDEREEMLELLDYAQFVMDRSPELLKSIIFNTHMEQDTKDGTKYWPTWGLEKPVVIELNDVSELDFQEWSIFRLDDGEQVAHGYGSGDEIYYDDIDDPYLGKYAMMNSIKEPA